MRLVFMGTPEFARACLEKLHSDGFDIAAVYTKIDTPKNRGMKLIPSPVKEYAQSVGLPVYQPQSFRDEETVQQLRELKPDLLVVVAYGKILPQAVLDIPKYGAINMHGSILPQLRGQHCGSRALQLRGSAPVQRSILNHCDEAGVTAMYLSAGMDEGDIIEIRKTAIQPLETSEELMARLAQLAAPLCADTVRSIETGTAPRIPQDNTRATYAPMLSKEESPIDWNQPARFIVDHVRGLVPWPVATAELGGMEFKIYRVEYADQKTEKAPGSLVALTKKGLLVACQDGNTVLVRELQAKGGKRMPAPDYFRGHPITIE